MSDVSTAALALSVLGYALVVLAAGRLVRRLVPRADADALRPLVLLAPLLIAATLVALVALGLWTALRHPLRFLHYLKTGE